MKKLVPVALIILLFMQSCVVYQKTPVQLNEAHNKGKVKVVTVVGEILKFKNIVQKDSMYYGVNKKRMETTAGIHEVIEVIYHYFQIT